MANITLPVRQVYQPFPAGFCHDFLWDSAITWDTDNPDFTNCFQQTLLVWLPCGFLWLSLPTLLPRALDSPQTIRKWTPLSLARMVFSGILAVLSMVEFSYILHVWRTFGLTGQPVVGLIESLVKTATFLLSMWYIYVHKRRGRTNSVVLFVFWLALAIVGGIRYRTLIQQAVTNGVQSFENDGARFLAQMLYFPVALAQFLLTCFAERFHDAAFKDQRPCPEQFSSIPNHLTFWWVNRLVYMGWKKPLVQSDLWDLSATDHSRIFSDRFRMYWNQELDHMHRSQPDTSTPVRTSSPRSLDEPSLTRAMTKTIWPRLVQTALLRVVGDVTAFVTPQVMRLMIAFVSDKSQQNWKGYFYVVLLFGGAFTQVLAMSQFFFNVHRCTMNAQSAVVSSVYQKALKLSNSAKRTSTVGEIVNLMSQDSQRLAGLVYCVMVLLSAPLQIGIGMYFLWDILGPSSLAGLATMALLVPVNAVLMRYLRQLQVTNMKNKDTRIKLMNEILSGMKILKLYAWEEPFQDKVKATRELELATLIRMAYLTAFSTFLSLLSPFMVAIVTFSTFVLSDPVNVLDAQKAFVSLSLFNILRIPIHTLPDVISAVIQAQVSIGRLTKFMKNDELDPDTVSISLSADSPSGSSVSITNASFTWGTGEECELKDISLDVPKGSLVAVVGQVGVGKSSLCSAIIGLMEKTTGTVTREGSVAYVSQQAWIQNLSLKDNILFGKTFDRKPYEKVLDACALRPDLELLPAGDNTEIGENGINLSGGQKQRVSLARAVYSDADIYILDDPLSAVDAHVGKHIFEQVIGPGGMLESKTRVLVTHGIGYLPKVDRIIVLDGGTIAEVGTYKELLRNKGAFSVVLSAYLTGQEGAEESDDEETLAVKEEIKKEIGTVPPLFQRATSTVSQASLRRVKRTLSRQESKPAMPKTSSSQKKEEMELAPLTAGKLVTKETSASGNVGWSVYRIYFRYLTYSVAVAVFVMNICANAASVGTNVWLGEWSQDSTNPLRANDPAVRDMRIGVYGAIGAVQGIFILIAAVCCAYGENLASRNLHEDILLRVMRAPMSFFDQTPLGRIINRFSKDIDSIDSNLGMEIRMLLKCILDVVGTLVVISIATPIFTIVILPLGILYYMIQRFFIPTSRQLKRLESVSRSPLFSHFQESLTGSSLIVATNSQERFVRRFETLIDTNNTSTFSSVATQRWLAVRVELIGNLVTVFAAIFAVVGRDQDWNVSPKDIGLSISYALTITQSLNWVIRVLCELEAEIVSVERVKEYAEIAVEAPWVLEEHRPPTGWPKEGGLVFKKYETKYRPDLEPVLRGVTCRITSGEKIGIVGRTGAGKSSLTLALFRIIEGTGGSIILDDVDISTIGLHDLRSRLTIIPQDPILFSGTLRENLDPFLTYTEEEVWRALEDSHLKRFVSALPDGLSHIVAEGGDNLSVGQRQLICLARALLRKTKILVMDEATAAVDLETDTLIQATIREKFVDCTVLTIAHRINTILDSTRIMVLDKGLVKEFDSPAVLLGNRDSLFYGLAKSANVAFE